MTVTIVHTDAIVVVCIWNIMTFDQKEKRVQGAVGILTIAQTVMILVVGFPSPNQRVLL
jgi:hypothetical protein